MSITDTSTITVLYVDDDASLLDLVSTFLEREREDVRVLTETDARAGLNRLDEVDCVVSDYQMPGMDGLEFLEEVRAQYPELPFVLYTGKGSEEIASEAISRGVTDYLQKGTGTDQYEVLANRVTNAVESARAQRTAERYQTLIEALGYPVYILDDEGYFEAVNEPFVELTGYDREEILGSPPGLIKDEEAVRQGEDNLRRLLSSDGPNEVRFELEIIDADGERIPCEDHMCLRPYEGEFFVGSMGILREISDRRKRERELELKTRAMEEADIGITISDYRQEDNPLVYVNEGFEAITGYDREEVLGRNCRFLQGPETDPERVAKLREAIEAGESTSVDLLNYRADGTPFWNHVDVTPVRDGTGEITHWFGFQRDVTKRMERERELERQNERLTEFASILSHDLRNPLSVARGRAEILRDEYDPEHVDVLDDALERMSELVDNVLTLTRQGDVVDDPERVELLGAIERAAVSTPIDADQLRIEGDLPAVEADEERLRTLLENLFRNAAEHAGPDPTIRIGPLDDGFLVEDDGPGIPPDEREDVFASSYSTDPEGTGFGLAIVSEIVEAHGWSVSVRDGSAGGARFEFRDVDVVDRECPETEVEEDRPVT